MTYEEKKSNKDFQMMLNSLQSGGISLYGGDGSKQFLNDIGAGIALARGNVQDTTFMILRGGSKCWMICKSPGTTGIGIVDDAHVNASDITEQELLNITDSATADDIRTVYENDIYFALNRLAHRQTDL